MSVHKLVPVEPTPEMIEAGKKEADWYEHNAIYCYQAMIAAAPAVQAEPVGWQFYRDGKWRNGGGLTEHPRKKLEEDGYPTRDVYAAPQPVKQQPAPDVSALVEALEKIAAFQPKDILYGEEWKGWNRAGEYAASVARYAIAAFERRES